MKKNILSFVLSLCMILTLLLSAFSLPVMAEGKTIVTLGDSISTGYGLEGYIASPSPNANDSFINLIAKQTGSTAVNLAVDGLTSKGLLDSLAVFSTNKESTLYKTILDADMISITIGGNDLLGLLFSEIATAFEMDNSNPTFMTEVIKKAREAVEKNDMDVLLKINMAFTSLTSKIEPTAKVYEENLTKIIAMIKTINKDAKVVVQTIINPYKGISNVEDITKNAVLALNKIIIDNAKSSSYAVADVYNAFSKSQNVLTNATNKSTYLDPHPNKEGHAMIAKTLIDVFLGNATEPVKDIEPFKIYADVTTQNWYYEVVAKFIEAGILSPNKDEKFNGDSFITNGEVVELLAKAFKLPITVDALKALNILPAEFNIDDKIMRQELFVFIYQILSYTNYISSDVTSERLISDFKDSSLIMVEAIPSVEALYKLNIINGNGDKSINPLGFTTKSETVQLILNILNLKK